MKRISILVSSTVLFLGIDCIRPILAAAQDNRNTPTISLSVKDKPLGTVLEILTAETGYTFKLNEEWKHHLVSATIENLPMDQGLNRLMKSLNHTIVWEAKKSATIMVYGEAEPGKKGGVSFAAPPRSEPPPAESEPETELEQEPEPAEGDTSKASEDTVTKGKEPSE